MKHPERAYMGRAEGAMPLFRQDTQDLHAVPNNHCWDEGCSKAHLPSEQAHARNSDPETSHKAAATVVNLGETREIILNILRKYGPQTDEQIAEHYRYHTQFYRDLKASPSGLRSRRSELQRMGFVVDSGARGKTASGRDSIIWRIA